MPRLPAVSGKEVVAALERLGFRQVRQRGSHVVMRRGDAGCVVPMHGEVRKGTLAEILRQSHVSISDLTNALK